VTHFQTLR